MVARLDCRHCVARSFDDTGWLMAQDCRHAGWQRSMNAMEIAMAHSAGNGPYEHFVRTRLVDLDLFNSKRLI
jgi:hypothetical protein